MRRFEILRKSPCEGIETIIETPYNFSLIYFVVIEFIIKGLVFFDFPEPFGKKFLKDIPTHDSSWMNTIIPFLIPFDKSVREESHPYIFMLVIRFKSAEEGI